MHHGYYPPGQNVDNRQAQIDMIENSLTWAQIPGETGILFACHWYCTVKRKER